jgi:hypothetical protein
MPLAIVLAAAWVETLSVREIANKIDRSLDLLEAEMRDAPARHRSIRAMLDSTWNRVRDAERDVLMTLQGAADSQATPVEDVGVDHGCLDVFVTQKLLDGANIVMRFQEVGGKAVTQSVGSDELDDTRQASRPFDRLLQAALVQVMAARDAGTRILGKATGWENVLPAPFPVGVGVFARQRVGQVGCSV